jgi:hypothetical protein
VQWPSVPFDGNWVDICSLATGVLYIVVARCRRKHKLPLLHRKTGIDFANGAALFPLLLMTTSVVSSGLVKGLVDASKMSLSVAGFFAILAILEDDIDQAPAEDH